MKKSGILAVALSAAMIAVPLAACGEAAEYNPADYAYTLQSEEVKSVTKANKLYTDSYELEGQVSLLSDDLSVAKVLKANGKYVLYDLENKKPLLNGKAFDYISLVITQAGFDTNLIAFTNISETDPDDVKTGLCTVTGDEFLSLDSYENVEFNSVIGYLNGSLKSTTVYSVTYKLQNASKETTKYYTFDKDTNKTTVISSSEFRTTAVDMAAGVTANAVELNEIYDNEKENPLSAYSYSFEINNYIDNPISDVTYSAKITAYKDGAVVGTVSMENAYVLGSVGNYLYYYEVTALPQSAKDYNVEYQTKENGVISTQKFDYTLYQCDIVKGEEAKKVKADYLYTDSLQALYNNTAKAYDKAAVTGYKFEKGVAFISEEVMASELIVDDNLAVSYDMTGKPYSVAKLIRLKDNRFFTMSKNSYSGRYGYILDENLEAVATLPSVSAINADQQLIVCSLKGKVMAVDFDGKIVFEPKYGSLNFYGEYALTSVYEKSGKRNTDMIVSKTDPNGKSLEDLFKDYGNEGVNYDAYDSGYIVKSVTSGTTNVTTVYSLYNYAGTKITDLDGAIWNTDTVNGKLLITVIDSEDAVSTYVIS